LEGIATGVVDSQEQEIAIDHHLNAPEDNARQAGGYATFGIRCAAKASSSWPAPPSTARNFGRPWRDCMLHAEEQDSNIHYKNKDCRKIWLII